MPLRRRPGVRGQEASVLHQRGRPLLRPSGGQVEAEGAPPSMPHGQRRAAQGRRGDHQVLPSGGHEGRHILHIPPGRVRPPGRRVDDPPRGNLQVLVRRQHLGARGQLLLRPLLEALGDTVQEQRADRAADGPQRSGQRQDRRHRGGLPPLIREAEEGVQGPHMEAQEGQRVRVHGARRQGHRGLLRRLPRRNVLLLPVRGRIRHKRQAPEVGGDRILGVVHEDA